MIRNWTDVNNGRTEEEIYEKFKENIFNIDKFDYTLIFSMCRILRPNFIENKENLFKTLQKRIRIIDCIIFNDKYEELTNYKEEIKRALENIEEGDDYLFLFKTLERYGFSATKKRFKYLYQRRDGNPLYEEERLSILNKNLNILLKNLGSFKNILKFCFFLRNPEINNENYEEENQFLRYIEPL